MNDGETLPANTVLLRVLRNKPLHVTPDTRLPTAEAFLPSSADLAHDPVRVSVWDERITVARAIALRGVEGALAFRLAAADVTRVAGELGAPRLRAVHDPGGATGCGPADARWHHGVEGLEAAAWPTKVARMQALRRLALACEPTE